MNIAKQVGALGLPWPEVSKPGGHYQSVIVRGEIGTVAIQFPIWNGHFSHQGLIGSELNTLEACEGMRLCALNVLAHLDHKLEADRLDGFLHADFYYRSVPGWDEMPLVADAASSLFVKVLGTAGEHSRALIGVAELPRSFAMGLCVSFKLKP